MIAALPAHSSTEHSWRLLQVESPDGSCALFGRSKKVRLPLYTCLAGFVDQVRGGSHCSWLRMR